MHLHSVLKTTRLLALGLISISSAPARTWTDTTGRTIEAELITGSVDSILLKMGGREVRLAVDSLCEEDQEYVREWMRNGGSMKTEDEDESTPEKQAAGAMAKLTDEVPERVGPPEDFKAIVVDEDSDANKFSYSSPHFLFISDRRLTSRVVSGFSKLYEATYLAVKSMPWGSSLDSRTDDGLFPVYLFSEEADFLKAGGIPGSAGTASGSKSLVQIKYLGVKDTGSRLILDDVEDNDVIVHELTHALRNHADRGLPVWAVEGFAEYITSAPYNRNGKFTLKDRAEEIVTYIGRRGAREGAFKFEHTIEELLGADRKTFYKSGSDDGLGKGVLMSYSSAVLVMGYLWHSDKGKDDLQRIGGPIRAWLAAIQGGKEEEDARSLLFDGRTGEEMQKALISFYRRKLDITFP